MSIKVFVVKLELRDFNMLDYFKIQQKTYEQEGWENLEFEDFGLEALGFYEEEFQRLHPTFLYGFFGEERRDASLKMVREIFRDYDVVIEMDKNGKYVRVPE